MCSRNKQKFKKVRKERNEMEEEEMRGHLLRCPSSFTPPRGLGTGSGWRYNEASIHKWLPTASVCPLHRSQKTRGAERMVRKQLSSLTDEEQAFLVGLGL